MDLQSEQFMTLLSDALRAGPASPQWHQAVAALRANGSKEADELQALIRAREDLESGREYRQVRAGPGFSRKVLAAIDEERPGTKAGLPSANILALLAAGVILAVVVVVAVVLLRNSPNDPRQQIDQLRNRVFGNSIARATFDAPDAKIGSDWITMGEVALKPDARGGLRPASTQPSGLDKREYRAGAVIKAAPIAADQAVLLDVSFKMTHLTDAIVPQVQISEEPIETVSASSSRELVWLVRGGAAQVLMPDLSVKGEKASIKTPADVAVKIWLDRDNVIVEMGDKVLYKGPHMLSAEKPRYVGVRFLRKVGDGSEGVWLRSIQVLKPQ